MKFKAHNIYYTTPILEHQLTYLQFCVSNNHQNYSVSTQTTVTMHSETAQHNRYITHNAHMLLLFGTLY